MSVSECGCVKVRVGVVVGVVCVCDPVPFTLYPVPFTLDPVPFTLDPVPLPLPVYLLG